MSTYLPFGSALVVELMLTRTPLTSTDAAREVRVDELDVGTSFS
jgi:hypothetical protein